MTYDRLAPSLPSIFGVEKNAWSRKQETEETSMNEENAQASKVTFLAHAASPAVLHEAVARNWVHKEDI